MARQTYETMAQQAVNGLDVLRDGGLVRVRDGQDTWVCERPEWDAALATMDRPAYTADDLESGCSAYGELCDRIGGTVISLSGSSQGSDDEKANMVRRAVDAGLLDADEALARKYAAPQKEPERTPTVFDGYLGERMKAPEFRAEYEAERARLAKK